MVYKFACNFQLPSRGNANLFLPGLLVLANPTPGRIHPFFRCQFALKFSS